MPRLSFIVPVYRPKIQVFERHLKSIIDQALDSWEAIYVLDGPCPEAEKLLLKMRGDKEIIIKKIEHSGVQTARNVGGKLAMGDFYCFMDCDCILEPGASKAWVEQFDKRPEVYFIYSGYKFLDNKYAIDSEPFDPFTLRIRNYISGCFPMRKEVYPGWTEGLKSLQDWDVWLSVLEKVEELGGDVNKAGLYLKGYAFATAYPDPESISGQGCGPSVWLDRLDAVKKLHHLPERSVCVSSLDYHRDGVSLAKMIDADYQDDPSHKPHRYKTIVQIGFSLGKNCEKHAAIFGDKEVKKVLFWTGDNINEMYHAVSFQQIDAMSLLLNKVAKQYCEDREAQRLLARAGFKAEIMPIPLGAPKPIPLPKEPKWVVDNAGIYTPMISTVARSLPDIQLDAIADHSNLADYTGLIHFFPDKTTTGTIKRAILTGRHVISNVQQPYCGFIDDKWDPEKFIVELVDRIREKSAQEPEKEGMEFYAKTCEELKGVLA